MRVVFYGEITKFRWGNNDPYWFFRDNDRKKIFVMNKFEDARTLNDLLQKRVYVELMRKMYENADMNRHNYDIGLGFGDKENDTYNVILKLDLPGDLIFDNSLKRYKNGSRPLTLEALEEDRQMIIVDNADAVENDMELLDELRDWIREDNAAQIQSVLCRVWMDFKSYIDSIGNDENREEIINKLKVSINYSGNRIPTMVDYSDVHVQQIYTLVFDYMYMLIYYTVYKKLLEMHNTPFVREGLKVISFGCGAKLDGISMKIAIESIDPDCEYSYRGIDRARWDEYNYNFWVNDNDFYLQGVLEFLDRQERLTENVFFFPTSISEFDRIDGDNNGRTILDEMLDLMIPLIESDQIFVVTSVRDNNIQNDEEAHDRDSMEKIRNCFEAGNEWSCVTSIDSDVEGVVDRTEAEREYNELPYPESLKDGINTWLHNNIRYSMMTDRRHFNFYIMEFRRNG